MAPKRKGTKVDLAALQAANADILQLPSHSTGESGADRNRADGSWGRDRMMNRGEGRPARKQQEEDTARADGDFDWRGRGSSPNKTSTAVRKPFGGDRSFGNDAPSRSYADRSYGNTDASTAESNEPSGPWRRAEPSRPSNRPLAADRGASGFDRGFDRSDRSGFDRSGGGFGGRDYDRGSMRTGMSSRTETRQTGFLRRNDDGGDDDDFGSWRRDAGSASSRAPPPSTTTPSILKPKSSDISRPFGAKSETGRKQSIGEIKPSETKPSEAKPEKQAVKAEKSSDKQAEKSSDKHVEKSSDKQVEKSSDKQAEKLSDKKVEKSSDKQVEKSSDKQVDKSSDKQIEKTSEKEMQSNEQKAKASNIPKNPEMKGTLDDVDELKNVITKAFSTNNPDELLTFIKESCQENGRFVTNLDRDVIVLSLVPQYVIVRVLIEECADSFKLATSDGDKEAAEKFCQSFASDKARVDHVRSKIKIVSPALEYLFCYECTRPPPLQRKLKFLSFSVKVLAGLGYPLLSKSIALSEAVWDGLYLEGVLSHSNFVTWLEASDDNSAERTKVLFQLIHWSTWLTSPTEDEEEEDEEDEEDEDDGSDDEE